MRLYSGVYKSYKTALNHSKLNVFEESNYEQKQKQIIKSILNSLNKNKKISPFYFQHTKNMTNWVNSIKKKKVRILDFGGGWGVGYVNLIERLKNKKLKDVEYHIYDLKNICEIANNLFNKKPKINNQITYHHNFKTFKYKKFDLVFLGSCLQYSKDVEKTLELIKKLDTKNIMLIDVYAGEIPSFCTLQNYYKQKIPHWFLNYSYLNNFFKKKFNLVYQGISDTSRLGIIGRLDMSNFKKKYRLGHSLNLIYQKKSWS